MSSMKDQLYETTKSSCQMNTCTEDNTQRVGASNQWHVHMHMHAQQQFDKWNRMHVHVTMFVSVCTIITRQIYGMPHTCINHLVCASVLCT